MDQERPHVDQTTFARSNRSDPTHAEAALWNCLKRSGIGFKFTRQHRIGRYFVDFCCRQLMLVAEVDGDSHQEQAVFDAERDAYLKSAGYEVLRFRNETVTERIQSVVAQVQIACEQRPWFRY